MSKRSSSPTSFSDTSSYTSETHHTIPTLLSKKDQKILGNAREIAWLQCQIADMAKDLHPRTPQKPIPEMLTIDDLYAYRKEIDDKRNELLRISEYITHKEKLLSIVQQQLFIEEALYPSPTDSMDQLEHKRAVEKTIAKQDQMEVTLMKELQALQEKTKLVDIQKEIDTVEQESMEMFNIHHKRYNDSLADKSELLGLMEREGQLQEQTEMARNVLVGMILESHIDWTEEPQLNELMLKIGDDFEAINRRQLMKILKDNNNEVHPTSPTTMSIPDNNSITSGSLSVDQLSLY
ncbi:hypothetical protein K501DRAFT_338704 [Backusella circina FSU 941]|nr:hypothetical protein K501DRAFT_338704 [Backusella circina FSU 941]